MTGSISIACIQMSCIPGNVEANLEKCSQFIQGAVKAGAELIVLPELFNFGYHLDLLPGSSYNDEKTISFLSKLSSSHKIYIAAGIIENDASGYYNSLFVFDTNGHITAKYRKINIFTLGREAHFFLPGSEISVVTIKDFKFGLMICFDIRFPELARIYYNAGCHGILFVSAFPFPRLDHYRILLKARAIENQFYIAAANRTGSDNGINFLGNSCIIDPWGTLKVTADETEEGFFLHILSLDKINDVRKSLPCEKSSKRMTGLNLK